MQQGSNGAAETFVFSGERLKAARLAAGLTMQQFASIIGCGWTSVWFWESGQRRPRGESMARSVAFIKLAERDPAGAKQMAPAVVVETPPMAAAMIRTLRDTMGLQADAFAQLFGVRPETISRWENGKSRPEQRHMQELWRLAKEKGVTEETQRDESAVGVA